MLSIGPIKARVGGRWANVSTDVRHSAANGWCDQAQPAPPEFADNAADDDVLSVERAGYVASFSHRGAAPSPHRQTVLPRLEDSADEVHDDSVFNNVDLSGI